MNYLAHAYLSFNDPEILVGNMISDYVKGRKKFSFRLRIQDGINLHRAIDSFTDTHAIVKEAKQMFRADYRLYAGAFVDVSFDHFLATDRNSFDDAGLMRFSKECYHYLENYIEETPEQFQKLFPYMKKQNWLYNYQFHPAMKNSFDGLKHRAAYIKETETAFAIFESNYSALEKYYHDFFPELKSFCEEQFRQL
ncbi:MAG: DUF479 domain-containing protein [Gemmatimonadaceae bacterium]|nr:DUF479 domain-containing protein [Chitinophagaceae bacterium]